jgi:amidophosphoribosyltransferase
MLEGRKVLFCDDSIVRGTQLRDNARQLHECGAKEVHMRIACPPLVFGCPFLNFSASKTELELITRRVIRDLEGDMDRNVDKYTDSSTPEYARMVSEIARQLNLDSLRFSTREAVVKSIGLPREDLCLHCFDGSSAFTLEQGNK